MTAPVAPSLVARIEERLLVGAYASRWPVVPVAVHRSMALPLQLAGRVHHWTVSLGQRTMTIIGIGRRKRIQPLCTRLFGELPPPREGSRRLLCHPATLAISDADLIVAEVHRWTASQFRRAGWLIVPSAVRWQGELATVPPRVPCRSLQENLDKVRRHGFSLEQSTSRTDWDEFYRTMVEPHALVRHGAGAWVPSVPLMRQFEQAGTLLRILQNGQWVAATCALRRGDTVWLPLLGVRDGAPGLLRAGASVAALALPLEWARSQQYRRVDVGRTSAFVSDGLQQYKRKWGFVPGVDPLTQVAAIRVGSSAARQAFALEPVLVEDGRELRTYAGE